MTNAVDGPQRDGPAPRVTGQLVLTRAYAALQRLTGCAIQAAWLVDDTTLDYRQPRVPASALISTDDEAWWAEYLDPVPSWVHLDVVTSSTGGFVLAVCKSANASPTGDTSVNVSDSRAGLLTVLPE